MDAILEGFSLIGARAKVKVLTTSPRAGRRWNGRTRAERPAAPILIDVVHDEQGEFFDLRVRQDTQIRVSDACPADRHLLLMSRESVLVDRRFPESHFLCGHDERSWFVAAIPESSLLRATVQGAKDALKPQEVWEAIHEYAVLPAERDLRRTAGFVRQGEWFFIPRYELVADMRRVLWNEPIRRGAGKPHVCQCLYRQGGQMVYVSDEYPNGLTRTEYSALPRLERDRQQWTQMAREAKAYVRGSVSHSDHETVWLFPWHEVVMNTETKARAMQHVAFLD